MLSHSSSQECDDKHSISSYINDFSGMSSQVLSDSLGENDLNQISWGVLKSTLLSSSMHNYPKIVHEVSGRVMLGSPLYLYEVDVHSSNPWGRVSRGSRRHLNSWMGKASALRPLHAKSSRDSLCLYFNPIFS